MFNLKGIFQIELTEGELAVGKNMLSLLSRTENDSEQLLAEALAIAAKFKTRFKTGN
jgi:hypothetical protein